jgi:hypothetical protein
MPIRLAETSSRAKPASKKSSYLNQLTGTSSRTICSKLPTSIKINYFINEKSKKVYLVALIILFHSSHVMRDYPKFHLNLKSGYGIICKKTPKTELTIKIKTKQRKKATAGFRQMTGAYVCFFRSLNWGFSCINEYNFIFHITF